MTDTEPDDADYPPCTPTMRWCQHGSPCCGHTEWVEQEAADNSPDAYRWTTT